MEMLCENIRNCIQFEKYVKWKYDLLQVNYIENMDVNVLVVY